MLKALAFDGRGKPKDAYDMCYVLENHADGPAGIASRIRALGERDEVGRAIGVLTRDFRFHDAVGVLRAAEFLGGAGDARLADIAGCMRELLDAVKDRS